MRRPLINACLKDAKELMELVSKFKAFHIAVTDGKNEFLKLLVLAKGIDSWREIT